MAFMDLGQVIRSWTKIEQTVIEHALDREYRGYQSAGADQRLLQVILLEKDGGACPLCSKPWEQTFVTQLDANFHYWKPTCNCLGTCKTCGTSLHREHYQGISCLSCRGL